MEPLTAAGLLSLWEQNMGQTLLQKTLNLLRTVCPEMEPEDVAKMHIGERDARLLLLRQWLFGPRLLNIAGCPGCSERIEWDTDIDSILTIVL